MDEIVITERDFYELAFAAFKKSIETSDFIGLDLAIDKVCRYLPQVTGKLAKLLARRLAYEITEHFEAVIVGKNFDPLGDILTEFSTFLKKYMEEDNGKGL